MTLPIVKEPLTLTYYMKNQFTAAGINSYDEVECYQEIEKRTGINIEWVHGDASQAQIDLMIASGDTPDIMWVTTDKVKSLLDGGVAIRLNEYIDKYAPDFKRIIESNINVKKETVLPDGTIASFPGLVDDLKVQLTRGMGMRGDWLEKLNLNVPVTIEDWYKVMCAFRDKDPNGNNQKDEWPLGFYKNEATLKNISTAWGLRDTYQRDPKTDKIIFGPIEPAYKDYLKTMAQWYKEGLIVPHYKEIQKKEDVDKLVLDNQVGIFYTTTGTISRMMNEMKSKDPNFKIICVPNPVGPAGKSYSNYDAHAVYNYKGSAIITNTCKHPVEAVKLINYFYSEEGSTLLNWGIEGKSYVVDNGVKKFTDLILNNPEGKDVSVALMKYADQYNAPRVQYYDAYKYINFYTPEQQQAVEAWSKEDLGLVMPVLTLTDEESKREKEIMDEVNKYKDQMFTKFVQGEVSIDTFDEYVKTIKDMGIEEAIRIRQAAYDRYNSIK